MNKLQNIEVSKRNMNNTGVVTFHFDDGMHTLNVSRGEDRHAVAIKLRALADRLNKAPEFGGCPP